MNINNDFDKSYKVRVISETNGNEGERYYYPSGNSEGGKDGVMVLVYPENSKGWLGTFAFEKFINDVDTVSGVYTTPSPHHLCVVSGNKGYWVSSKQPTEWHSIEAFPIVDVKILREKELILFSDFTTICAYGVNGFKWRTKRICPDGFIITSTDEEFIVGKYTDWDQYTKTFGVNLNSGEIE